MLANSIRTALIAVGFLVLCGTGGTAAEPAVESFLAPHDKIMWIGDSITAQNLYETYVMRVLETIYAADDLSDVNCGIGGATAPSQFGGIPAKFDAERPTIVTAMFGVNDTGWSPGDAES